MIKCDMCEQLVPHETVNKNFPDRGLILAVDGYYGGFTDNFDEPAVKLLLCHDCSATLFYSIPKLSNNPPGLHASISAPACCSWSHSPAPGE